MKIKKNDFKAVEFMRSARKRLTEKYQKDRKTFLADLEKATLEFKAKRKLKSRKKLINKLKSPV